MKCPDIHLCLTLGSILVCTAIGEEGYAAVFLLWNIVIQLERILEGDRL